MPEAVSGLITSPAVYATHDTSDAPSLDPGTALRAATKAPSMART